MPKFIFDSEAEWDQNEENVGIQTEDTEISLDAGATPLQLADDFNDGVRDPLWKGHFTNSLIAAFDPPSPSDEPLGVTNLRIKLAQSFTLPIQIELSEIQLKLQEFVITTLDPDLILEIQTDNGGEPSGTVLATKTLQFADVTPLSGFTPFPFNREVLPASQKLWMVFYTNPIGSSGEHINWLYDLSADLPGESLLFLNGSTLQWQAQFVPTHDFYHRISRAIDLNPKPTEASGFLSFEYQNTGGSGEHIHMIRDFAQGDWEFETRFQLRRLAPNFNSGQFIIGILQGSKVTEDGALRDAKLLHQFRFNTQDNFNVSYSAEMVDGSGVVHTSGSPTWPNVNFQAGFIANDPHIFNLKVTRVGNGLKYLFYHSDNVANVLLETSVSPDVRTLPGDIHLDMGSTSLFNNSFGVAFDFDFVNLNITPQQFLSGFLRLRHSFGVKTRLQTMEFQRLLPNAGDLVQIQFRSGSTIQALEAATFGPPITTEQGSFDPGNPQSEYERSLLSEEAEFFETKITLNSVLSPGPTCQKYVLEFTEVAPPVVIEEGVPPLTFRRHIDSDADWNRFIEKSSSLIIENGAAKLASVFADQFDGFTIEPEWTVYQRNASVFESFDFLRMDILSVDSDSALIKTDPIPTDIDFTVRHKFDGASGVPSGSFYLFNVVSIHNNPILPTPNDLRVGGIGTGPTHFTVILRRSQFGDGQPRIGIVALRNDGTFVGWDQNLQQWNAGTQDQIIPPGKENDLFTFDVSINAGVLNSVIIKDGQGSIVFDTSSQPLNIKIFDNQPFLVLGDSDLSDMPAFGTQQQYDSVETNIPVTGGGTTSGFIRLRDSLAGKGRLGTIRVVPSTNIQFDPAPISIKARSGNTLQELINASFQDSGQFIPNVNGNDLEIPNVAPASFLEIELSLFSQSPGPEIILLTWEIEPLIEDNPIILSKDVITPDVIVVSASQGTGEIEDQSTVPNIKDGDPNTQWLSNTGQEGFGISWSLTIGFQEGTTPVEKIIDVLYLRNTNFKTVTITLTELNSNNPETVFSGELLTPDAIITFPPKLTAQIIIAIGNSQFPNERKALGEIYAGQILVVLPGFDDYEPRRILFESGDMRTLGGNLITYRGITKYASSWRVTLIDDAITEKILDAVSNNPTVEFLPESKSKPRELIPVAWKVNEVRFPYTDVHKGAGRTIEAEMEQL